MMARQEPRSSQTGSSAVKVFDTLPPSLFEDVSPIDEVVQALEVIQEQLVERISLETWRADGIQSLGWCIKTLSGIGSYGSDAVKKHEHRHLAALAGNGLVDGETVDWIRGHFTQLKEEREDKDARSRLHSVQMKRTGSRQLKRDQMAVPSISSLQHNLSANSLGALFDEKHKALAASALKVLDDEAHPPADELRPLAMPYPALGRGERPPLTKQHSVTPRHTATRRSPAQIFATSAQVSMHESDSDNGEIVSSDESDMESDTECSWSKGGDLEKEEDGMTERQEAEKEAALDELLTGVDGEMRRASTCSNSSRHDYPTASTRMSQARPLLFVDSTSVSASPAVSTPESPCFATEFFDKTKPDGDCQGEPARLDEETESSWDKTRFELSDDCLMHLESMNTWSFDMFQLQVLSNDRPLVAIANEVMLQWSLYDRLNLDFLTCLRFFADLEDHYGRFPDIPYHNNLHGADVTHSLYYILSDANMRIEFADIELLAALVAAAGHDVAHPGFNNQFLKQTKSKLALLYNDQSILENYHASTTFRLLGKEQNNFMSSLSSNDQETFRSIVIEMILSTDMAKHFVVVNEAKQLVEQLHPTGSPDVTESPTSLARSISSVQLHVSGDEQNGDGPSQNTLILNQSQRLCALRVALHCADIASQTKDWDISIRWSERVIEEFYRQGDKEKMLGVPVGPLNERDTAKVAQSQVGFIDFAVVPCWECWTMLLQTSKSVYMNNLISNRHNWQERQKELDGECNEALGVQEAGPGAVLVENLRTMEERAERLFNMFRLKKQGMLRKNQTGRPKSAPSSHSPLILADSEPHSSTTAGAGPSQRTVLSSTQLEAVDTGGVDDGDEGHDQMGQAPVLVRGVAAKRNRAQKPTLLSSLMPGQLTVNTGDMRPFSAPYCSVEGRFSFDSSGPMSGRSSLSSTTADEANQSQLQSRRPSEAPVQGVPEAPRVSISEEGEGNGTV
eukprot:m.6916 g.6916  ORF g.6916 m.6916 type:complete len:966 (+) comp5205_c0_seq1:299-3196(+)